MLDLSCKTNVYKFLINFMNVNFKNISYYKTTNYISLFFKIGIFLLVSAPAISSIFLLLSSFGGVFLKRKEILKDKYNYFLFFITLLLLLISSYQTFFGEIPYEGWVPSLSWIGLLNWIPLFFCFIGFQPFLNSRDSRRKISLIFLIGTVPLIISGILQYFFKVHGPFETLNGLVIWYSRPLESDEGLTGLFNNRNYAGSWLSIVFPFAIAYVLEKETLIKRTFSLIPLIIIVITMTLTFSRSAWLNALLSFLLVIGKSSIFFLIIVSIFLVLLSLSCFQGLNDLNFSFLLDNTTYSKFCSKFSEYGFSNSHRLIIFENAINLIKSKPLIGYGASSFAALYFLNTGRTTSHSHNILMDLALNYGLVVSVLIGSFVIKLIFDSFNKIYQIKKEKLHFFDKAWWTAGLIMMISHLYDNTYYDLRISISCWVILAGLRNISRDKQDIFF